MGQERAQVGKADQVKQLMRRQMSARLESRANLDPAENDLAAIARYVPEGFPKPTAKDVHVASALVCNDLVDHFSTRFTEAALRQIVELLPGTNVQRNHNEYDLEALPVGRIFAAELVQMPDGMYVRAYFYWERGTEFGDQMAKRIMLGVWREVSLSWWMASFTNSIDGGPMDESPYYAGQTLPDGQTVVGVMDDVVEVNEVSLVPRGGQKNTAMGPSRSGHEPATFEGVMAACRKRAEQREHGLGRYFPAA